MARRWQPEYEGAKVGRVVLIHDVAASSATWGRVGPALAAQGWDTLALDLPAHGTAADRIDRPLDISSLAAAVIGQLPGRADLLVGHGLGGIVALVLVGHYPDIARAVVLEDPPAHSPAGRDALIQRILLDSAFSRADPANLAARMKGAHPHWTDGEIEQAIADLAAADVPSIIAGLRSRLSWDLPALIGSVRRPLLVLAAREDFGESVDPETTALRGADRKEVRNQLPEASFVELESGHYLHCDLMDEWVNAVTTFGTKVLS